MNTRFIVLPDNRNLMLGRDLNECFKPGVVYEVKECLGEFIISPIGKPVIDEKILNQTANTIIDNGYHLITEED